MSFTWFVLFFFAELRVRSLLLQVSYYVHNNILTKECETLHDNALAFSVCRCHSDESWMNAFFFHRRERIRFMLWIFFFMFLELSEMSRLATFPRSKADDNNHSLIHYELLVSCVAYLNFFKPSFHAFGCVTAELQLKKKCRKSLPNMSVSECSTLFMYA